MDAVFVDLSNFYAQLLKSGIAEPKVLREYFLYWLDFDRISERLTGTASPVWVFYSGHRLGPKDARIDDQYLEGYIARLNSQRGVTAYDVNIPGRQREPATYHCERCGNDGIAQWESEKGIDSSLTVHMFDTSEAWEAAYLLSGDADYVPAVASLRRRGKIVSGAGFLNPSASLVRECYQYLDLIQEYVLDDFAAYALFAPNGLGHQWLTAPIIRSEGQPSPGEQCTFSIEASYDRRGDYTDNERFMSLKDSLSTAAAHYDVTFYPESPFPIWSRMTLFDPFRTRFPQYVSANQFREDTFVARLSPLAWRGIEARLPTCLAGIPNVCFEQYGNTRYKWAAVYKYDPKKEVYDLVGPQ